VPDGQLAPLLPGWLVAYRDPQGRLRGGCDERESGTVQECQWNEQGWMVHLTDGQRLPLSTIRSVGRTDDVGKIVAAWTVRGHGFNGEGSNSRGGAPLAIATPVPDILENKADIVAALVPGDWLTAWREVAELTSGLTADDPRLPLVMAELLAWDDAGQRGDWAAFRQTAARVRIAVTRGGQS